MASTQYGYPPPPPPPPSAGHTAYPQQYQQQPYGAVHQPSRGGGRGRGRGGNHNQGGRGDFHVAAPYNQHAGGYNGPPQVGGGYVQQNPAQYIGPQPPVQGPPNGYPPQQWHDPAQQHHQPPPQHHHQQPQVVQAPAPVPLSAQNYHPNYAPQVYQQPQPQQQPPQYGPQQPSFQHSPPPNSYAQNHIPPQPHPSGPPQQQWQGQPHHAQPPYQGGGRGRGRGGPPHRGGFDTPLMMPPIRMGFDNERPAEPMSQASNGYPPPYAQQQGSPAPFSQPQFQGYPERRVERTPRPALDPNPFYSGGPQRGRGGFHDRGRRGGPNQDRFRGRGGFNKNQNSGRGSFGSHTTDLPQKPAVDEGLKSGEGKKKKKKKRKTNTLGLTPATEEYQESEEEDDLDEESRLAANLADSQLPSDLDTWLAERRAKWPTKARREAKEAELAKRRAQAAEQSARDKARSKKEREDRDAAANKLKGSADGDDKLEKQRKKAEKLRKALERAERKIQDGVNAGMKRKRESGDIGDEEDAKVKVEEGDHIAQVIAKVEAEALHANNHESDSSSGSSEYTSGSESESDSAPETHTTRQQAPIRVPPPPKKAILQRHCKYFATGGTCGKKGKCRFIHDEAVRAAALKEKELNGGRPTLAQRLAQNDREKADLMVLKSIKHLYERGHLNEPNGASAVDSHDDSTYDGLTYSGPTYTDSTYNNSSHNAVDYSRPSYNPAPNFMDPFQSYDEMQPVIMDEV